MRKVWWFVKLVWGLVWVGSAWFCVFAIQSLEFHFALVILVWERHSGGEGRVGLGLVRGWFCLVWLGFCNENMICYKRCVRLHH